MDRLLRNRRVDGITILKFILKGESYRRATEFKWLITGYTSEVL